MYTIDLADYSGRTLYSLFYLPASGQVMASEIFYTFGASSYLYTEIDLTSPGASYPATFTYHTRTSETVASLSLPAASLTEASPLPAFSLETSGTPEISESEVREYFRQMLLETLSAVQQVMDSYELPITLEHFGFSNL